MKRGTNINKTLHIFSGDKGVNGIM